MWMTLMAFVVNSWNGPQRTGKGTGTKWPEDSDGFWSLGGTCCFSDSTENPRVLVYGKDSQRVK